MQVAVLQHVPFEGLGSIGGWLDSRGASVGFVRLFDGDPLPDPRNVDWVIAMGGPMSVNDEGGYPWLRDEKRFIRKAIGDSRVVVGICLGAQLIASSLGAKVYRNEEPEIGWFPVTPASNALDSPFAVAFRKSFEAFHWHGETFDLPPGAALLARSDACANQAFSIGDKVLGLQFHLEATPESAGALCEHCAADLRPAPWVQGAEEILHDEARFRKANERITAILDRLLMAGS